VIILPTQGDYFTFRGQNVTKNFVTSLHRYKVLSLNDIALYPVCDTKLLRGVNFVTPGGPLEW